MTDGTVHIDRYGDGVAVLRLDRPPVNAMNPRFLAHLDEALDAVESDAGIRALVLTGEGRSLSGGMDLKEVLAFSPEDQRDMVDGLNRTFGRLYGCPKPVICAANGAAIAGGMFLVLVSDYRVAGERAQFGLAEVRVAVRFPVGAMDIARAELGASALRRIMLSGRNHDAATALALGAVDEVVPGDQVLERALAVAADYARLPPQTFASIKREIRGAVVDRSLAAVNDRTDPMRDGWFTGETQDAVTAVLASLRK